MTALKALAFTVLVAACSRDNHRSSVDSLPPAPDTSRTSTVRRDTTLPDTGGMTPAVDTGLATGVRITVERAVVNGVLWGASEEEARKLLGAPQRENRIWEEALGDTAVVLEYPGMKVRVVEERVVGINCTAATCITGDAIRIGATRSELEQVYGKGQVEQAGTNGRVAFPFTTDDSCALRFELSQGKVREIDVSCQEN